MKNFKLRLAIAGAILVFVGQAQAAGFTALPAIGFTGTAYMPCYNTGRVIPYGGIANNTRGNFGSYPIAAANLPSAGSNDACWVAKPVNEATLPAGFIGYTVTASTVRNISNPDTSNPNPVGEVYDRYWRNPATNTCIIGTRVRIFNEDSDAAAGKQLFEVNDIVRSGFSGAGTVNVAYTIVAPGATGTPVYRVGRTFTSVQHRALKYDALPNKAQNGINYLDLPTNNTNTVAMSGEPIGINSVTTASTSLATQDAMSNSNHVDFTVHVDGFAQTYSAFTYIEAACDVTPTVQAGAIRLRQTGQEATTMKAVDIEGYAIGATTP